MAKCDVCGKTSLLSEKLGVVNVCQVCFMKTNGLMWKHQYERKEEAEKQRCRALESAHKHIFPDNVIFAINEFFVNQINAMRRCDCCGQYVVHLQLFGKANMCKQCWGKMNIASWKKGEYEDNIQVEKDRENAIKNAYRNGFSPITIDSINMYFDSKIEKGLIRTLNSYRGQKLKVYETHCVLITEDHFNIEENVKYYNRVIKKSQPKESFISSSTAKSLAYNVLTSGIKGGIVKTGISLATSAAINATTNNGSPDKSVLKIVKGNHVIDYTEYDTVDYQEAGTGEKDVGYIRFRNSKFDGNPSEDVAFIFSNNTNINEAYSEIKNCMYEVSQKSQALLNQSQNNTQSITQNTVISAADEILKFKNLLDMGAITQDEFDAKKKELLGL